MDILVLLIHVTFLSFCSATCCMFCRGVRHINCMFLSKSLVHGLEYRNKYSNRFNPYMGAWEPI